MKKRSSLKQPLQSTLIVLYGKRNSGKTTTLIKLLELLAGNNQIINSIKNVFYNKNGKAQDCRIVVEHEDKLIFIATFGDSWSFSRVNTDFFEFSVDAKTGLYVMNSDGVRVLSNGEYLKYRTPDYCICACRPDGDGFGAMKAYLSYMQESAIKYDKILWVRKNDKNQEPSCNKAKELFDIIKGNNYTKK